MTRKLLLALLCGGLVVAAAIWHQRHAATTIGDAVEKESQRWLDFHQGVLREENAKAEEIEATARATIDQLRKELQDAKQQVESARADLSTARGRLLNATSELRRRAAEAPDATTPGSIAHGAIAASTALEECSQRYEEVAGIADDLTIKVTGWQRYFTEVVVAACQVDPEPPAHQ